MAYITRKQQRLFLDIETASNDENLTLMPEPKAPGNLKDPAKIEAAIAEKRAELIANAALDPDYGKILSIGWSYGDAVHVAMVDQVVRTDSETGAMSEADVLDTFWYHFAACSGNCVGYNILGFDLPYLLRRSMYLGVKVPYMPVLARYKTEPVTDLMMILCNWDTYKAKGLKQMCKLLRIPNDLPDVDGSKVATMTPDELRTYQASDVKLTMALYDKMNGVYFSH